MSQLESDKLREDELYKTIFQSGILCYFCRLTEDVLRCDILYDQSPCKRHLCVRCFKKYRHQPCEVSHKYEDHFSQKKLKFAHKIEIVQQAQKTYQRQSKVRGNLQYVNLDFELINLMAYLQMNAAPSEQRVNFVNLDNAVKQALGDRKRQERKLHTTVSKTKKANYINRIDHRSTESGIETCGYNRCHQKGITLVRRAFDKSNIQEKVNKPPRDPFFHFQLEEMDQQFPQPDEL